MKGIDQTHGPTKPPKILNRQQKNEPNLNALFFPLSFCCCWKRLKMTKICVEYYFAFESPKFLLPLLRPLLLLLSTAFNILHTNFIWGNFTIYSANVQNVELCNRRLAGNKKKKQIIFYSEPFRFSWILFSFQRPFSISLVSISSNTFSILNYLHSWISISHAFWIKTPLILKWVP